MPLRTEAEPAAACAAGRLVIHTCEGHRPDLTDCPPAGLAVLDVEGEPAAPAM